MDQLLPRARPHPDTPGSGTEEETSSGSCCYLAFCCLALSGILAAGALAGASLGYEVGLNISLPRVEVPFNSSMLPLAPLQSPDAEGRGEEQGRELPGPTVEDWSEATVDREDLEWQRLQKQWKTEETDWRTLHAVNQTVFYMYRAQSSKDYPPVNINTADLGGVLWYLHNEIVRITPRKYSVRRILRFKVTVKNTEALQRAVLHKFGPFVAFDSGKCTVPTCDQIWNQYGFVVGCQVLGGDAKYSRELPCEPALPGAHCHSGIWYSLPGPCPTLDFRSKSVACKQGNPGGECGSGDVTGEAHCTYHVEQAGWVDLDEYTFIRNYTGFIEEGRREYDPVTDKGERFSFWDGMKDQKKCNWRMNRLQLLFKRNYPELPATLEPPPCPG